MSGNMSLTIDGDKTVMDIVQSIVYSDSLDEVDMVQVHLVPEITGDRSKLIAKLLPGAPFAVKLLDGSTEVTEHVGVVLEVHHRYLSGGRRSIQVIGVDNLHKLQYGAQEATLWEASHDKIVSEIASRNGLTAKAEGVDTTPGFELQSNVSDAVFIARLAKRYNYYARVVDKELQFGRRQGQGAAVVVEATDVIDMKLGSSLTDVVTSVTAYGSDYLSDEAFTGEAAASDLQKITGSDTGVGIAQSKLGKIPLVLNQTGLTTATALTALAKSEMQLRAERFVTGTVTVKGNPKAASGSLVDIKDLPWPFTGKFLIRQTRHIYEMGGGYRTAIDVSSDSLPKAS